MVLNNWTETTADELFGENRFYQWLKSMFAEKNHTHEWVKVELNNNYATLYVNEMLQLAELRYVRSFASADPDRFYTWHTGLIPEEYRPSSQVQGVFNQTGIIYIDSTGTIGGKFPVLDARTDTSNPKGKAWTTSRSCIASIMWRFGLRTIDLTYTPLPEITSENHLLFIGNPSTTVEIRPIDFSSIPIPFVFRSDVPSGFRLMSSIKLTGMDNIKTSQFATKANATLEIRVTASNVKIIVNGETKINQAYTLDGNDIRIRIIIDSPKPLELANPTLNII